VRCGVYNRTHIRTHTDLTRSTEQTMRCAGADHEVQRILLELLNQMDGFDQSVRRAGA
jgi:hypothetical protein